MLDMRSPTEGERSRLFNATAAAASGLAAGASGQQDAAESAATLVMLNGSQCAAIMAEEEAPEPELTEEEALERQEREWSAW